MMRTGTMANTRLAFVVIIAALASAAATSAALQCINTGRQPFAVAEMCDMMPMTSPTEVTAQATVKSRVVSQPVPPPRQPPVNPAVELSGCQRCCGFESESDSKKMKPTGAGRCSAAWKGHSGHCCGAINGKSKCCPYSAECVADRVGGRITG